MVNWKLLDKPTNALCWKFIYDEMQFTPHLKYWAIAPAYAQKKFDLSKYYGAGVSEELYANLHEVGLDWFQKLAPQKRIYALDWQHECYSFNPFLPFERNEFDEWPIALFPNGDYTFFLTEDFKNVLFCDGINSSIFIYGEELLKLYNANKPKMFIDTEVSYLP